MGSAVMVSLKFFLTAEENVRTMTYKSWWTEESWGKLWLGLCQWRHRNSRNGKIGSGMCCSVFPALRLPGVCGRVGGWRGVWGDGKVTVANFVIPGLASDLTTEHLTVSRNFGTSSAHFQPSINWCSPKSSALLYHPMTCSNLGSFLSKSRLLHS